MNLSVPELSLVILVGASGAGKSHFAAKHFKPTEVISSDACRAAISDDENDLSVTKDAFELVRYVAAKRLEHRRLTVIDATSVRREDRAALLQLARTHHCLAAAIVFDLPESLCLARNAARPERDFGPHVVRNQTRQLRRSLKGLKREGFRYVHVLTSPEEVAAAHVQRHALWTNKRGESGPFDLIGDVHGCCDELEELLDKLGYTWTERDAKRGNLYPRLYAHPGGRKAVFLGDLTDRGPRNLDALGLVRAMVEAGNALCVPGNHDVKLLKKLRGKEVKVRHGLERTVGELDALPNEVRPVLEREMASFLDSLVSHYMLDGGKLVAAHAGLREDLQGRASGAVRSFALFGETTGETDEHGLPVRRNWAASYRGEAFVVYSHTPVAEPLHLNRTLNIDTGCVFGGALTALRYPEMETVSVPAKEVYAESARPFLSPTEERPDDGLDIDDVLGKRQITTRLRKSVTIREENAAAALEVMSRAAVDPKWLIYLPPTMAAPQTTRREGLLEHPHEAFTSYRREGVKEVVCQEKHMGSRTVLVLCRDQEVAARRFGVTDGRYGIFYTRTGRPFFSSTLNTSLEQGLLARVRTSLDETNFWRDLQTDWVCLDAELTPWSAKAQRLLETQYAAVGTAAEHALARTLVALGEAEKRGLETHLQDEMRKRSESVTRYREAYRRYCWNVASVDDLKLAPFHLLATEGAVHTDKTHVWHMETLAKYLSGPSLQRTAFVVVDLEAEKSVADAVAWWEDLTARGGEGMVVKPLEFVPEDQSEGKNSERKTLVQPAIKVRGREYLRLIYGPEYALPQHLERLSARNISAKRSLALREFALGIEALERFVRGEPFYRVHECVFGVLALESEPVDPRL